VNIEQRPFLPIDTSRGKSDADFRRREWLPRQARLALLDGDSKAALALFQRYLAGQGRDILAGTGPIVANPQTQATIAEAKALYLANGGTEGAWLAWATSVPDVGSSNVTPASEDYNTALPDFEAKDLSGRVWRLSDLKGKATYIDIWATWCGACRAQHPDLERLHEALKGRKDIQVLTLSVDETAYLAQAYMKEKKYTFPVIVSKGLAEKLFPAIGYPQVWVVDALGRRSSPRSFINNERATQELERSAAVK
jgi:cytochrome c biogenesis protein CcmG/thiol:disulfide interchange protein DsbE